MANYIALTAATEKCIKNTPKFDESMLDIETIRNQPLSELPLSISRPDVDVEKITIDESAGIVRVKIYRPINSQTETLPAVLYIHGGGWALFREGYYDYICSKIAVEARCAVLFVYYSLSPEVRFPVALEQCCSVLRWATTSASASKYKIDSTRVAIAGDSCGGNLAIAVTLLANRERNLENQLKYQVLIYPVTDDTFNTSSYYEFGRDYPLTRKKMQFFWDQYIPEKEDRQDILVCPLKASIDQLKGLPPALIISAEIDVIRTESESYGRQLLRAGVPVTTTRVLGVLHGFVTDPALFSDETLFAVDMITGALCRALA